MNELVKINFNNQELLAIKDEMGNVLVAMKPICENLGLDWEGQRQRIQRDGVLNSVTCMIKAPAQDGKNYEVLALPLDYLNGWLFGIDDTRLKEPIKSIVLKYKKECYNALRDYFQKGIAVNRNSDDIEYLLENTLKQIRDHKRQIARKEDIIVRKEKQIGILETDLETTNSYIDDCIDTSKVYTFRETVRILNNNNLLVYRGKTGKIKDQLREGALKEYLIKTGYWMRENGKKIINDEEKREERTIPTAKGSKYFNVAIHSYRNNDNQYNEYYTMPNLYEHGIRWLYKHLRENKSFVNFMQNKYPGENVSIKYANNSRVINLS